MRSCRWSARRRRSLASWRRRCASRFSAAVRLVCSGADGRCLSRAGAAAHARCCATRACFVPRRLVRPQSPVRHRLDLARRRRAGDRLASAYRRLSRRAAGVRAVRSGQGRAATAVAVRIAGDDSLTVRGNLPRRSCGGHLSRPHFESRRQATDVKRSSGALTFWGGERLAVTCLSASNGGAHDGQSNLVAQGQRRRHDRADRESCRRRQASGRAPHRRARRHRPRHRVAGILSERDIVRAARGARTGRARGECRRR